MSSQALAASALAVFTLFMAAALVTAGAPQSAPTPAVATVQVAQANG
jgi:hypothetical protein